MNAMETKTEYYYKAPRRILYGGLFSILASGMLVSVAIRRVGEPWMMVLMLGLALVFLAAGLSFMLQYFPRGGTKVLRLGEEGIEVPARTGEKVERIGYAGITNIREFYGHSRMIEIAVGKETTVIDGSWLKRGEIGKVLEVLVAKCPEVKADLI